MAESYHKEVISGLKDKSLFIQDAFIDGKWVAKENKFDVFEPSTATVLGQVANCTLEDFQTAIKSADAAQTKYFDSTTGASRGALLRKWYDLVLSHQEDLAKILSLENGKTYAEALGEVIYSASFISWFAEEATRSYGVTIPSSSPHTTLMTIREPVGVCGIITPWNFPAAMITRKIAPALAAGCSVVIKPPSETPYSALAFTKLAIEAGLPPATIQVLPTRDRQAATELCTNPLVKKISFTGSTGVGKYLAKLATGTLKKVSLELGGNAPFIVFEDADLDLAAEGAMFCKFRCSGQTCVCAQPTLRPEECRQGVHCQACREGQRPEDGWWSRQVHHPGSPRQQICCRQGQGAHCRRHLQGSQDRHWRQHPRQPRIFPSAHRPHWRHTRNGRRQGRDIRSPCPCL
ncbi:succinate-semialdehyde dehydrogenase (NADP+) [Fusarium verticillioides 7600]|uniref:Succinate-semialdehyde dehydrogenase (NADP+) n=1 Tax=Gibberella moniliformis (strain M3125 / FGSC 7600) TaxID=334819 RepID=W7MJY0_GIBM7|nr:succinate-semialdehyde dehydrogenase (NADP+) [Fusarium verticillioides 7600]EWG51406.1 succinate-semialdehyde dehydrogenase (NADP+) [Fusarium verticillioides 7600]